MNLEGRVIDGSDAQLAAVAGYDERVAIEGVFLIAAEVRLRRLRERGEYRQYE